MTIGTARQEMAEFLQHRGVHAVGAWDSQSRRRHSKPVAAVSLQEVESRSAGFQHYLGERYDADAGQWLELYGRQAELTFGLDLYAPPSAGEAGLQAAFDKLMEALAGGGPGGLILREVSCGETGYDTAGRLLKRSVQAVYDTYLYAVAQPGGAFLDFEIRGEET